MGHSPETLETQLRQQMADHGRSLFARGYSCGSAGNLSARLPDGFLITPTNSSLGELEPARISKLDTQGLHLAGDPPSKEASLHLALYRARPQAGAVVHLHSFYCTALSCLQFSDPALQAEFGISAADTLPPLTPYYVMRVGRMPLVPYAPPGSQELATATGEAARHASALLLANHGPVVSGPDLRSAVYASQELEESAKLFFTLRSWPARHLSREETATLRRLFPLP